ncbi:hypothetical protein [Rothia sp. L_38]|uniref:hypothetical protein n=1 Tax=Rothia sp. L_38 TaxID=3422315 RepID=UPI003D6A3A17
MRDYVTIIIKRKDDTVRIRVKLGDKAQQADTAQANISGLIERLVKASEPLVVPIEDGSEIIDLRNTNGITITNSVEESRMAPTFDIEYDSLIQPSYY